MDQKNDPIRALVTEAISAGGAVTVEQITQLRAESKKKIVSLKTVFWIAIGLFNLMIWVPASLPIPVYTRWIVGLFALLVAIIYPIVGLRRQRNLLYQLEDCSQGPKRRMTDAAGRQYIDKIKAQGRFFVRAEYEVLTSESAPE